MRAAQALNVSPAALLALAPGIPALAAPAGRQDHFAAALRGCLCGGDAAPTIAPSQGRGSSWPARAAYTADTHLHRAFEGGQTG